jgi:hypothetical protein
MSFWSDPGGSITGTVDNWNEKRKEAESAAARIADSAGKDLEHAGSVAGKQIEHSTNAFIDGVRDPSKGFTNLGQGVNDIYKNGANSANDVYKNGRDSTNRAWQDTRDSAVDGARNINAADMWKRGKTGLSKWGEKVDSAYQDVKTDPTKAFSNVGRMYTASVLAGAKPYADAYSRWTGGSGDGVQEITGDEKLSRETTEAQEKGVTAAKIFATAISGNVALASKMSADAYSKYDGGSGDAATDLGANKGVSALINIGAAVAGGNTAGDAVDKFNVAGKLTSMGVGAGNAATYANIASGAAAGAGFNASMSNSKADDIANGALTGALTGGLDGIEVAKGTSTAAKAANASARGAASGGLLSLASGDNAETVGRKTLGGAAKGGLTSLVNSGFDIGKTGKYSPDRHMIDGVPEKGLSAELLAAQTINGGIRGGISAAEKQRKFEDGAKIGMIAGAAGSVAQQGASTITDSDMVQKGANIVGETAGTYAGQKELNDKTRKELFQNQIQSLASSNVTNPNSRGKTAGLKDFSFDKENYVSPAVLAAQAAQRVKYKQRG